MAKITANQRANAIAADQTKIQKEWTGVSSTINRLTLELKEYAAWKNKQFLEGNDFDADDMTALNSQFTAIAGELQANMALIAEVGAIPNADLAIYKTNNDTYIANNSINVVEYDKRYQV